MYPVLIVCILLNTWIVVAFKLFDRYHVRLLPAIVINYLCCVLTGSIVFQISSTPLEIVEKPWFAHALFLGMVFFFIFNMVGLTVKYFGVMTATIFQKTSLVAPALIGIIWYTESHSNLKISGIFLAFASVILIAHPKGNRQIPYSKIWIPIITFLGSAIIETTLYYVNVEGIAKNADPLFIISLFGCAFLSGIFYIIIFSRNNFKISGKDLLAGLSLGIPNYFSIYTILYLLNHGYEGSELFPIVNVSILVLSSIIGTFMFKEKLDRLKFIGFITALLAILFLTID